MNEQLIKFLRAIDLDDALNLRGQIGTVSPQDSEEISKILTEWHPPQAVANLLLHSALISDRVRFSALMRGLDGYKGSYFRLAAVVGLQSLKSFNDEERQTVLGRLTDIIQQDFDTIAQRASVSIDRYIGDDDLVGLFALLNHANPTVRHNILNTLIRHIGMEDFDMFMKPRVQENGLEPEIQQYIADHFQKAARGQLYSYIPNLIDWHTDE